MADQGTFIALEGADGSGKATQFHLLKERLKAVGYEVEEFDFPRYEKESSYFIRRYLNGDYGPATSVSPYTASLFYALDRYEAAAQIRQALEAGKVVISNRYVGANMAHQGSKLDDPIEQRSFFVWEDSLEFQLLNIPRPNINIFLNVPAEVSKQLITSRSQKTGVEPDQHEKDTSYLNKTVKTYNLLCDIFPQDFLAIDCVRDNELLPVADINNRIWDAIKPYLPKQPAGMGHSVTFKLSDAMNPPARSQPAEEKKETRPHRRYADKLSLDLILDIERLVPGSVTYKLDWQKNGYDYIRLAGLPDKTLKRYEQLMDALVKLHKQMRVKLKKPADIAKLLAPAVPMGALFDVELELTPSHIQSLVRHFPSSDKDEAGDFANRLVKQALGKDSRSKDKKNGPQSAEPAPIEQIISKLAKEHLPSANDSHLEKVTLLESSPRNEFKILADTLYPYSNLSREQLQDEIDEWSYQQKYDALVGAVTGGKSEAGDQVHYRFDVIGDRLLLEKIIKHRLGNVINTQPATPRYGYDVPKEVEANDLTDQYVSCFDKSLELFSTLQAAGREAQAPYATLLGHKSRYQIGLNLNELRTAIAKINEPSLKELLSEMAAKVAEFHPVIGDALTAPAKAEPKSDTPKKPATPPRQKRHRRSNRKKAK